MTALEVENLSAKVSKAQVLTSVSFSCSESQRVALVGRNGSGKTTLLRCLLGAQPYSGTIRFAGKELQTLASYLRAAYFAYVPQRLDVNFSFRVIELLERSQYRVSRRGNHPEIDLDAERWRKQRVQLIEGALEQTGVADLKQRVFSSLSMGERQRVLLAAALAQDSAFLLLDEPTASLDPRGVEQFFTLLQRLPKRTGYILVTHELNFASSVAQRIIALKDGEVSFDDAPRQFMNEAVLHDIYGIEARLYHREGRVSLLSPPEQA